MEYEAMSERDARIAASPVPPGWRKARVAETVDKEDDDDNGVIELMLIVKDSSGKERQLRDWLRGDAKNALKLRHAATAIGALDKYEAGTLTGTDFVGKDVRIRLAIIGRGRSSRNTITDYGAVPA